ncbi:MAG: S-layer homology domain-containing protein [Clostridia bacterium]|nr:S-layer homology domain-containing protein [Clostridia bacterium]
MKGLFWRRTVSAMLCSACVTVAMATGCAAETPSGTQEKAVVSYGVNVLSGEMDMAVSELAGNDVVFSADDFARALNLSKVEYITVTSLPAVTEGELLLGSTRIAAGQTVSASNISYMTFAAATPDIQKASFTFTANGGATPLVCNVYLLSEINYTPTVSMASGLSLNLSTYRDICVYGTLSAYDPDGDEMVYEFVSYPQNGSVLMTDRSTGSYVYTPQSGYVGVDSFSYVARDIYGNYSALATVNLKVSASGTSVTYVDMQDSTAYSDALALTEAGVMSGTQVGNQYYFHPEKMVSRVEFLVMAMNAAGITDVPACEKTNFYDDAAIPSSMKGYVAAAYSMGYISGSSVEGNLCFLPDEEITRAQAAVILSNIVGLCDVAVTPTFADGSDIPVWASEAIYSLNAAGILCDSNGYITPTAKITREQTAKMLAATMAYVK